MRPTFSFAAKDSTDMKKLLITILFIWFATQTNAQNLLTNSDGLLAIGQGIPLTVQGGVFNSGTILNEGDLRLSGDWSNSGVYSSVSGTFTLAGQNQIFDPGSSTYEHLVINSSGVVITNDLTISNSMELIDGIVSVVSGSKILLEQTASLSGGNENAYIDGALFTTTTGDFTFPVGTEFEYLSLTLTNIQSDDSVGVQAFSSQLEATLPLELDAYSPNRYWQIIGSESFNAEGLTLPLSNETFVENIDEAVIAFTQQTQEALSIIGTSSSNGDLLTGTISTVGSIHPGYYLIADQSVVGPPITVINVVTPLQDGKHDFLRIENIEFYEDNLVEIFDRQGVKIFEMKGYNNTDRVFRGAANKGSRGTLQTGNYYYTIKLTSSKRESGFVYVKN